MLIIYPPHLTYVRPTYGFVIFIRIIFIRHNIPVGAMLMLKPFSCRTIFSYSGCGKVAVK